MVKPKHINVMHVYFQTIGFTCASVRVKVQGYRNPLSTIERKKIESRPPLL